MIQTTLVTEHGVFFNYEIPASIGFFSAFSQRTDNWFQTHEEFYDVTQYDPDKHGDYVELFGLSES